MLIHIRMDTSFGVGGYTIFDPAKDLSKEITLWKGRREGIEWAGKGKELSKSGINLRFIPYDKNGKEIGRHPADPDKGMALPRPYHMNLKTDEELEKAVCDGVTSILKTLEEGYKKYEVQTVRKLSKGKTNRRDDAKGRAADDKKRSVRARRVKPKPDKG